MFKMALRERKTSPNRSSLRLRKKKRKCYTENSIDKNEDENNDKTQINFGNITTQNANGIYVMFMVCNDVTINVNNILQSINSFVVGKVGFSQNTNERIKQNGKNFNADKIIVGLIADIDKHNFCLSYIEQKIHEALKEYSLKISINKKISKEMYVYNPDAVLNIVRKTLEDLKNENFELSPSFNMEIRINNNCKFVDKKNLQLSNIDNSLTNEQIQNIRQK
tara:strand:+ start:2542 stop:3207 length:666 start_codon:yes stop_codon:yes gene_type:complete